MATFLVFFLSGNDETLNKNTTISRPQIKIEELPPNLFVTSDPVGATVLVNGENVGVTPFFRDSLNLKDCSVTISLAGYEKWTNTNFTLKPGANTIDAKLKPIVERGSGVLILKMEPPGTIIVNNKKQPTESNGILRVQVPIGSSDIQFVHPAYGTKTTNVKIESDQSKSITCYFRQRINIQSLNKNGDAFWGTIYINNVNTGKTTPGDTLLGPGTYNITVKKAGYKTSESDQVVKISPSFEFRPRSMVFHLE
jgi:hypothetical protein